MVAEAKREYPRVQFFTSGPSMTEQSHLKAANINNVIKKYRKTGTLEARMGGGLYGDFTSVEDYQSALHKVKDAQSDFESLPSEVRARFRNSPEELIRFVVDDNNYDEAVALGLVPKREPAAPVEPEEAVVAVAGVVGDPPGE